MQRINKEDSWVAEGEFGLDMMQMLHRQRSETQG